MSEHTLVAVYGTLKKGFINHKLLIGAKYYGNVILHGLLLDRVGFPGYVDYRGPGSYKFQAEVYEVDATTLAELDRLEGHPSHYQRVAYTGQVSLLPDASSAGNTYGTDIVKFYTYTLKQDVYCGGEFRLITDGIWRGPNDNHTKYAQLFAQGVSTYDIPIKRPPAYVNQPLPPQTPTPPVKTSYNTVFPVLKSLALWGETDAK